MPLSKGNLGAEVFINDIWGVPTEKGCFFFFSGAWGHLHPTVVLAQDQVPTLMGWFSCWGQ